MQNLDVAVPIVSLAAAAGAGTDDAASQLQTRMGYLACDIFRALDIALLDASVSSMGKAVHYAADIVCSGGYHLWQRYCYEYALDHIGLGSLRVFHYLMSRFRELDANYSRLPSDMFYGSQEVQKKIAEIMLVLQSSPRRPKVRLPSVGTETHRNETYLQNARRAPDSSAVRKIWTRATDSMELFVAANEMVHACTEGALERALFWMKWANEEDALLRKETGAGLSSAERGPANGGAKARTQPVHFLMAVVVEVYKELAGRGLLRMNEEMAALVHLYKSSGSVLTARRRQDILILILQILTEVPRWKVPAAQPVVRDPIVLERAVAQAPNFFAEVLSKPEPRKVIRKVAAPRKKRAADAKKVSLEDKLMLSDAAISNYFSFR